MVRTPWSLFYGLTARTPFLRRWSNKLSVARMRGLNGEERVRISMRQPYSALCLRITSLTALSWRWHLKEFFFEDYYYF